jgi:hypothetical protein
MYRYDRWWHGLEWPLGAAAVFLLVGAFMFVLVVTSASGVQWTGIRAHGLSQGGVVTYTYHGDEYTLPDDAHKTYSTPHPVTVWLSRSHPHDNTKAFLSNSIARWLDFSIVVVWLLIAAGFVIGGARHHRRFL